jgi:hypothetical protein
VYLRVYPKRHLYLDDTWIITNFLLVSLALLLMVPVLRVGRWWQRVGAVLLCLIPGWILLERIWWSVNMLVQP